MWPMFRLQSHWSWMYIQSLILKSVAKPNLFRRWHIRQRNIAHQPSWLMYKKGQQHLSIIIPINYISKYELTAIIHNFITMKHFLQPIIVLYDSC